MSNIRSEYENELVTRSAPRWAWETIDSVLTQVTTSYEPVSDTMLRAAFEATQAMTKASEGGE